MGGSRKKNENGKPTTEANEVIVLSLHAQRAIYFTTCFSRRLTATWRRIQWVRYTGGSDRNPFPIAGIRPLASGLYLSWREFSLHYASGLYSASCDRICGAGDNGSLSRA